MDQTTWDTVIVGAGMSGLVAAKELTSAGLTVLVIDKGRGVGGRMAYRRIGEAIFDHGAQYISARSEFFQQLMNEWQEKGAVCVWSHGFPDIPGEHPRWRGSPHMRAIPALLTNNLAIVTNTKVWKIEKDAGLWLLSIENGDKESSDKISCKSLIMTAPVPQTLDLLSSETHEIASDLREQLEQLQYHRCFAVMAVLDGPSGIPAPGVKNFSQGSIAWMADSQLKGISPVPCVTLHASHEFSLARWEEDRQATAKILLEQAAPWLSSKVIDFQIHGWRFSKPASTYHQPFALVHEQPFLAIAGDAFGGPNVEGAATSGHAVASHLRQKFFNSVF